jgi:acyl dehydratase
MGEATMAEQTYFEDVKEGQEIGPLKVTPDKQQLVKFAAGSGDFNPLHFDEKFANNMGLPETIVHGRFKYAQVGRLLSAFAGYKGRVTKFGVTYRGMDTPNKEITVRGVVTATRREDSRGCVDLDVWTEDADGKKTTPGTATVVLPTRS